MTGLGWEEKKVKMQCASYGASLGNLLCVTHAGTRFLFPTDMLTSCLSRSCGLPNSGAVSRRRCEAATHGVHYGRPRSTLDWPSEARTLWPIQSRNQCGLIERLVKDSKLAPFETDNQLKWTKKPYRRSRR